MRRGPGNTRHLLSWSRSPKFREMARQFVRRINATRHLKPKCGAARKHDGQPCQQLAQANGRCRFHGGATPAGKRWHTPAPPARTADADKIERKLADLARRQKKRVERLAEMTPAERERHEAWHRAHRPGPASARERARQDREARRSLEQLLQEDEPGRDAVDDLREGVFG